MHSPTSRELRTAFIRSMLFGKMHVAMLAMALSASVSSSMNVIAAETAPLTPKTAASDPRIQAIRRTVESVSKQVTEKQLNAARKNFGYCPSWDLERTQYADRTGKVRRYLKSGGSEDSQIKMEHTYDIDGHLRFVLIQASAVNDSHLELKWYLEPNGKIIWRDRKEKGPGYTWRDEDFERELVRVPKQAFERPDPCK